MTPFFRGSVIEYKEGTILCTRGTLENDRRDIKVTSELEISPLASVGIQTKSEKVIQGGAIYTVPEPKPLTFKN